MRLGGEDAETKGPVTRPPRLPMEARLDCWHHGVGPATRPMSRHYAAPLRLPFFLPGPVFRTLISDWISGVTSGPTMGLPVDKARRRPIAVLTLILTLTMS